MMMMTMMRYNTIHRRWNRNIQRRALYLTCSKSDCVNKHKETAVAPLECTAKLTPLSSHAVAPKGRGRPLRAAPHNLAGSSFDSVSGFALPELIPATLQINRDCLLLLLLLITLCPAAISWWISFFFFVFCCCCWHVTTMPLLVREEHDCVRAGMIILPCIIDWCCLRVILLDVVLLANTELFGEKLDTYCSCCPVVDIYMHARMLPAIAIMAYTHQASSMRNSTIETLSNCSILIHLKTP